MRYKPCAFVRRDDGEVFLLSERGTYYNAKMKQDFPDSLLQSWPEESFDDRRAFRPVAKPEDLQAVLLACKLERQG